MTRLYSDLAYLYDAMYQTFIDYEAEFTLYDGLVRPFGARSVLEIGCGSGHLAQRFAAQGYSYLGIDISEPMLALARKRCPTARFAQADMRTLDLHETFDAVLITARSLSYITTTPDVLGTFQRIGQHLGPGGTLHFDYIDAATFFPTMDPNTVLEHRAVQNGQHYLRQSHYVPNLATGFTWDWHSTFFTEIPGSLPQKIDSDVATLRAFLPDEIRLLLQLAGLQVLTEKQVRTYAFDTWVFSARKV